MLLLSLLESVRVRCEAALVTDVVFPLAFVAVAVCVMRQC
jgi:hypothetical protein